MEFSREGTDNMQARIGDVVMLPKYVPYPRYGRAVRMEEDRVYVTDVACGDPRCAAEHRHADEAWLLAEVRAADAYQPRAVWEHGRKSSPNAPLD